MARTHRDNQRRLDHIADRIWRERYYHHVMTGEFAYPTVNWGDRIWRNIPRYSQGRRGKKGRPPLAATKSRTHFIYGHHWLEYSGDYPC